MRNEFGETYPGPEVLSSGFQVGIAIRWLMATDGSVLNGKPMHLPEERNAWLAGRLIEERLVLDERRAEQDGAFRRFQSPIGTDG